jgi:DNA-binding response OmpR family regulator
MVIVLQNEQFYADFVGQTLKSLGFSVGGTFSKVREVLDWLGTFTPDVAIIDVEVLDGDCEQVADLLYARAVPYVVYSTMVSRSHHTDPILRRGVFLAKPSAPPRILTAVQEALNKRRPGLKR